MSCGFLTSVLTKTIQTSLGAVIIAMVYTSAINALIKHQLEFAHWWLRSMQGTIRSSFPSVYNIYSAYDSPISIAEEPGQYNTTCTSLEHAATGYYNY
jgi:hypothetical protein